MTEHDEQFDCNSNQVRDAERRLAVQHVFIGRLRATGNVPVLPKRRWKSCATSCVSSIARAVSCGAGW